MLLVGLTGGIGSGKSTFAALLAERGAHVIDADQVGRDALQPGESAWHKTVEHFGDDILKPNSREIDRAALARVVFADHEKLTTLNAIVHPMILGTIADTLERLRDTDSVVVLDAALLIETGLADGVDLLVVVDSPRAARIERLETGRGMPADESQARMDVQHDPEELKQRADIVVDNSGDLAALAAEADRVWAELEARR